MSNVLFLPRKLLKAYGCFGCVHFVRIIYFVTSLELPHGNIRY